MNPLVRAPSNSPGPPLLAAARWPVGSLHSAAFVFAAIYAFLGMTRLPETLFALLKIPLLAAVFGGGGLLLAVLSGGVVRALLTRSGILLCLFTFWLMVSTLFSTWHMGSLILLTNVWFKSVVGFFLIAGSVVSLDHCRKLMGALGFGAMVVVATGVVLGQNIRGRFGVVIEGTAGHIFSNANGLSMYLIFTLPFTYLLASRGRNVLRWFWFSVLAVGLLVMLRTGSRFNLVVMAVVTVMLFARFSLLGRLKLLLAGLMILLGAAVLVSDAAWERYRTIFGTASSGIGQSALESTESRLDQMKRAAELTASRPLVGVGPGNFAPSAAGISEERDERAAWLQTHNAYLQVASEAGIPGFLLYTAALLSAWWNIRSLSRRARRAPDRPDLAEMLFCMLVALTGLLITELFDSNTYSFHIPILLGVSTSLARAAEPHVPAARPAAVVVVPPPGPRGPLSAGPPPKTGLRPQRRRDAGAMKPHPQSRSGTRPA